MTGSDGIAPADHRPLPRAATWRFMTELRRRARGPPVDSRDDHSTVVAGLDRTARPTKITTVRSQTSRPASHGHLAMTCMIAITGLDDFLQTESAITITGIRILTSENSCRIVSRCLSITDLDVRTTYTDGLCSQFFRVCRWKDKRMCRRAVVSKKQFSEYHLRDGTDIGTGDDAYQVR